MFFKIYDTKRLNNFFSSEFSPFDNNHKIDRKQKINFFFFCVSNFMLRIYYTIFVQLTVRLAQQTKQMFDSTLFSPNFLQN